MTARSILALFMLAASSTAFAQQQPASAIQGYRDPGTATLYSVALPGGGQFYSGDTGRGLLLLGGSSAAILAGTALSSEASCKYDAGSPYGLACKKANRLPLTIGALASLGIWGYGVFDAKKSAERHNTKLASRQRANVSAEPVLVVNARHTSIGAQIKF